MKKTSYKEMLRNRVSANMQDLNLALKWCKAKNNWINHVYDNFINIYVEKKDRYEAVRIALGLSNKNRDFDFHSTICWDNLDNYDYNYWNAVEQWVIWFQDNIEQVSQDLINGATIEDIEESYTQGLNSSESFARYLVNNLS